MPLQCHRWGVILRTARANRGRFSRVFPSLLLGHMLLLGTGASAADAKSIQWNDDIQKASMAAVRDNKPMLLDFWAAWCDPCKKMDSDVYSNPKVIEVISAGYVPVRINFDVMKKLNQAYEVTNLPMVVLTDSYGTELLAKPGYLNADALDQLLHEFPTNMSHLNMFDQVLSVDRNDLNAVLGMATELRRNKLFTLSNHFFDRVLKLEMEPEQKAAILAMEGFNDVELTDSTGALKEFQKCLKEYPASSSKPMALLGLGQAYALAGERDKAASELNVVIAQYPKTGAADKARAALNALQ